ncbi:MAG: sigma-54 interaction domain-containing protein [Bryobacteraceae bacterium]
MGRAGNNAEQGHSYSHATRVIIPVANIKHDMVGQSTRMLQVYGLIARVAPADATVLIHGESGTGKELAACAIHSNSRRAAGPFIAINCAALPENLLESELFGYMRGAFTGAVSDKKGKLELAAGGTLFLDEVGELSVGLQAKLLRALQEREFERVGGIRPVRVNVRILAATNTDLVAAIKSGSFRQDLYFRLNVVSLHMPPLRERREDILLLADSFVRKYSAQVTRNLLGFSTDAQAALLRYQWPGNVRELQNAIERAMVLGSTEMIEPEDLPAAVTQSLGNVVPQGGDFRTSVRQFKKQMILSAISMAGGNYTEAAKILDMHPNYLHRLVRVLELRGVLPKSSDAASGG